MNKVQVDRVNDNGAVAPESLSRTILAVIVGGSIGLILAEAIPHVLGPLIGGVSAILATGLWLWAARRPGSPFIPLLLGFGLLAMGLSPLVTDEEMDWGRGGGWGSTILGGIAIFASVVITVSDRIPHKRSASKDGTKRAG